MSNSKMHNMATTHPKLLSWFASKNPIHVFIKLIPLVATYSYDIVSASSYEINSFLFFILGLITWSLFEYVTHRWLYHTAFKNKRLKWFLEAFHLYHHHELKDYRVLNAGIFLIYPIAIFFWIIIYWVTQSSYLASFYGLGTLTYYYFYENIHYYIHYKVYTKGYMQMIQKYHLFHHYKKWNKNYGNTITTWDKIFNTYDVSYKNFTLSKEQLTDLKLVNEQTNNLNK